MFLPKFPIASASKTLFPRTLLFSLKKWEKNNPILEERIFVTDWAVFVPGIEIELEGNDDFGFFIRAIGNKYTCYMGK